jgi:signal peptidase I
MRVLRFGVGLVSLALVSLLATLVVLATLLPALLDLDRVVLVSGSMSPSMVVGDVVLVDTDDDTPPGPGTVIVFDDPDDAGGVITHRVVESHAVGVYRTQGDANATPDTFSVTSDMIKGRGRLLVPAVGYPSAMHHNGRPGLALLLVGGVIVLAFLARYGVARRFDPWLNPAPARSRPAAFPHAAVGTVAVLLVGAAVLFSMHFSGAAFSATTANQSNSVTMTQPTKYYLRSSGTGNVTSSATLPITTTAPTATTLSNYDTNRNSAPGLTIQKGTGLNEPDASKIQRWNLVAPAGGLTLTGTASLTVWSAMKDFDTSKSGHVAAGLYHCDPTGSGCVSVGSAATVSTTPWSAVVNGWSAKTWSFGAVNTTIAQSRILQVRVATLGGSGDDVMYAYATTAYPSAVSIG